MNPNTELAVSTVRELLSYGVEEFCVCPGARSAPWIAVFKENSHQIKTYYFFEERSAAFFALGRIRKTGKPVAVVTTSGTAVGELLPATMEAHYVGLPLILLTADRPRRYRNSGSPQTAEQVGILGVYVSHCFDLEKGEKLDLKQVPFSQPFHVNVCFDEPLLEREELRQSRAYLVSHYSMVNSSLPPLMNHHTSFLQSYFRKVKTPFVIVGMIHPDHREAIAQLLLDWGFPTYFEGISGLREDPRLGGIRIHSSERILERARQGDYLIDGIIRIGGVPTLRLWRDLDLGLSDLPVLNMTAVGFSGLGRSSYVLQGNLTQLAQTCLNLSQCEIPKKEASSFRFWIELDQEKNQKLQDLLALEPRSEPGMLAALSRLYSRKTRLYLGNSSPIREWDLAADPRTRLNDIWASRGVNGIDGQVSQFLGFAEEGLENWAVLGDLTALYDLPGPWILQQLPRVRVNLAVINNGGGKIFSRMFSEKEFQNQHSVRFESWASLWGLKYEEWKEVPNQSRSASESRVIEVLPDEEATQRFWEIYRKI
jgi:2-succinyl-5-enolpyruvyl-6-hydroxy-3-cyclohexene-1-carboxylate synthase